MTYKFVMKTLVATVVAIGIAGPSVTTAVAGDVKSSDEILRALKPKPRTRGLNSGGGMDNKSRSFIKGLRTRQIVVEGTTHVKKSKVKVVKETTTFEERKELKQIIIKEKLKSIDLTILFEYDSVEVKPHSVKTLIKLGQALSHSSLKGSTILIAGHTDASGSDYYNRDLSKRRAFAIKNFLYENFGLDPKNIVTVGYGEEDLIPGVDPYAEEHRRVQVTNLNVH